MAERRAALALLLAAALLAGCRLEDRTPTGSRHDDAALRALLAERYRVAGDTAGRMVRLELDQQNDLAAAWVWVRGDGVVPDGVEHLVLRRDTSTWRIVSAERASPRERNRR